MQYVEGMINNHAKILHIISPEIITLSRKKKGKKTKATSIIDAKNKVCPQTNFLFFNRLFDCFCFINFERKYDDSTKAKIVDGMISMRAIDLAIISAIATLKITPKKNTRFQRLSLFHRSFINFFISKSSTLIGFTYINCTRNSHKSQRNN